VVDLIAGLRDELTVVSRPAAHPPPGIEVGQVSLMQMIAPADRPYVSGANGSKYQGQRGPTPSRCFENFSR
jgi:deoxycytidine triphosphate deaminase